MAVAHQPIAVRKGLNLLETAGNGVDKDRNIRESHYGAVTILQ